MVDWAKETPLVVLKFHYGKRGSTNSIISKTMGRVAVISHSYEGSMPQAGSFWLCKLEREMGGDKTSGCFIVSPIHFVPIEKIFKLVPGTYETDIVGKTVVCRPRIFDKYCIIPFSLKKYFIKKDKADIQYQSIVVPVTFTEARQTGDSTHEVAGSVI